MTTVWGLVQVTRVTCRAVRHDTPDMSTPDLFLIIFMIINFSSSFNITLNYIWLTSGGLVNTHISVSSRL